MNAMSMLTRGYICPGGRPDDPIVIGPGPEIVDKKELVPEIARGKTIEIAPPTIIRGEVEDDDPCP